MTTIEDIQNNLSSIAGNYSHTAATRGSHQDNFNKELLKAVREMAQKIKSLEGEIKEFQRRDTVFGSRMPI